LAVFFTVSRSSYIINQIEWLRSLGITRTGILKKIELLPSVIGFLDFPLGRVRVEPILDLLGSAQNFASELQIKCYKWSIELDWFQEKVCALAEWPLQ
jgi:hypothetical protein